MIESTPVEARIIAGLQRIARRWPASLWLYAADGVVHVMRCGTGGTHVVLENGGVDPAYIVDSIRIDTDGGDW